MVGHAIGVVLSEVAGFEVLAVCASVSEACFSIRLRPPRLLVVDPEFQGRNYLDALELLHALNPSAELLFITAGAASFEPPADLALITVAVVDKHHSWDRLLEVLRNWWRHRPDHRMESLPGCDRQLTAIGRLSPRERRLLLELGSGLLNRQIADRLRLTPATVASYRKSVAAQLGISGSELVRLAVLYRCLQGPLAEPSGSNGLS